MHEVRTEIFRGPPEDAPSHLSGWVRDLGAASPLIVASKHGLVLAEAISGGRISTPAPGASIDWASGLGAGAHRAGCDLVIAIGGGRCLDLAKLAAARAGLPMVSVPTQLSHDGLCSPVAVVPDASGTKRSVGAIAPRSVYLSLPLLLEAPAESVSAGIGDLIANPYALRDWRLAADHGIDEIHDGAWEKSERAYSSIERLLDRPLADLTGDPAVLETLAEALILSGVAMIEAGTSRPASGGEHEISHAIDELYPDGATMHGAQVAFGCIISAALYGDDAGGLIERLGRLNLPVSPASVGLTRAEVVDVILAAPDTRPGRFTIIEDAALDEGAAATLVERLWPD